MFFMSAKQYSYEVHKSKSLIFDAMKRTVLVIPTELSELPVMGMTILNGLHYKFRYRVINH
ncbi:hypothetical protein NMS_1785 [Nonlabens marinus S1-08]|uniref:Uncharacterized protein n=1 Tax=Nonlabens marinus S1-08 TaxID=1454201 RepID=W8VQP1_9FLAO|nr:hypothetical protein NMS_1785 [Nonlabens marinus S1-08]